MKALEYLASRPWAIRPDALEVGLSIALREHAPAAVAPRLGRDADGAEAGMTIDRGVAVIPVLGPIFRYADWFTSLCGGSTTEAIALDLRAALDDPSVRAVLLNVDSPGGEAAGIAELAGMVRAGAARKPVVAYADHDCCSAAYWIAASASELVVSPTAVLGSIGVVMAYPTRSDSGKRVEFVSSQSPNKRPDVSTERGKAEVQRVVDDMADVFIADVASARGTTAEAVVSDFGGGGLLVGAKAVAAGMADRVGTYEGTLAGLAARTEHPARGRVAAARPQGTTAPLRLRLRPR